MIRHMFRNKQMVYEDLNQNEKIKVILTMTTTQRRYHIALVNYLPAGCEALNTSLKGTITGDTQSSITRSNQHENLRDERAEAFRSLL